MTARKPTRGSRDNTGAGGSPGHDDSDAAPTLDPDAQQILEYLDERGGCTIDQLAGKLRLPRAYLKQLLRDLETDGYITVDAGFSAVRIERVDASRPALADGGERQQNDADADADEDGDDPDDSAGEHTNTPAFGEAVGVDLSAEDVYRVIKNKRRRDTVRHLAMTVSEQAADADGDVQDDAQDDYVEVETLATAIAMTRTGTPDPTADCGMSIDTQYRMSVYVTLIQTHLPLLEDVGLLEYYKRPQKVAVDPLLVDVAAVLEGIDAAATDHEARPGADSCLGTAQQATGSVGQ